MVSFSLGSVSFLLISVFIIATLGYMLGRITIKGVSLGTAGVFIVALVYGAIFGPEFTERIRIGEVAYASEALKTVENLGLILFVTSVGFIAGPNFFKNMKKNFKSYVLLGLVIILTGGVATVACVYIDRLLEAGNNTDPGQITAIITGILSGALTSTPAFSATKEAVQPEYTDAVTVGYGIAYLFGVIGVVLFVQLMPKFVHANMDEERSKLIAADVAKEEKKASRKLIDMDDFGLMPFALAAVLGVLVGSVKFFKLFSLTTTGGTLLASLLFGHFGHIGPVNIMPQKKTLENFREFGLMLFLIGAGIAGGMNFVRYFKAVYFLYGILITTLPMIVGYFVARKALKMSLLNSLGSITGGMTSTPALGTLIHVAGTDDVASAYAATYPIALISVVLVSELIVILF
ncbi:MAG: permease [Eubacteriales bacterium]|nr:permease [Clostridiales bacterium]MDD7774028.1 permease [Eubacteriales bacterium]MDY3941097.1 permease [Eubacteriales bacterium]